MSSDKEFEGDAGAPLPDFTGARNISLNTIGPALGQASQQKPDYLDYDQKGRGLVVTMFANTGLSYLIGICGGGVYGLQRGITNTPSSKFKVQLNSIMNHCGRYGSKAGNQLGVFAVMYSLYEGLGDAVSTTLYCIIFECMMGCTPELWYQSKEWKRGWRKRYLLGGGECRMPFVSSYNCF
jgi:hypothetical protein